MLNTNDMVAMRTLASQVTEGAVIRFDYNGKSRCVQVERVTDTYVQGRNIPHNGEEPTNTYSTYSFSKMESEIEQLLDLRLTEAAV